VIVTGSSSGIGKATARRFSARGRPCRGQRLHAGRRGLRSRRSGGADPSRLQPGRRSGLHRLLRRGQNVRDVPGGAQSGELQPGLERLPGREAFGSKTQHAGVYDSNLSTEEQSTAKAVQAYTETGWKFVNCPFTELNESVSTYSEGRNGTGSEALDKSEGAHNPKVGGSNPPPATQKSAGQSRSDGPTLLLPAGESHDKSHERAYHSLMCVDPSAS